MEADSPSSINGFNSQPKIEMSRRSSAVEGRNDSPGNGSSSGRFSYLVMRYPGAGEMCVGFFESSQTDQCDRGVHVIALGIGSAPEYPLVGAECRAGLSFRFPEIRALGAP
jgi:hypothetical protein